MRRCTTTDSEKKDSGALLTSGSCRAGNAIYAACLFLLMSSSTYIFYRQATKVGNVFQSDLSYYIRETTEELGTRLLSKIFYAIFQLTGGVTAIAIYMGLIVVGIAVASGLVIKEYLKIRGLEGNDCWTRWAGLLTLFSGSIYIPHYHHYFYRRSWNCFVWHSPTQQTMIFFSVLAMLFLLKLLADYRTGKSINVRNWIGLAVTALLAAWTKPSFMLTIAPAIIVVFVIELLIRGKGKLGKTFFSLFVIGCAYIPAGLLVLYFSFWYKSENSGSAISYGLSNFLKGNSSIAVLGVKIVCGLLLPLIVFAFNAKKLKDVRYNIAFAMIVTGVAEWMFIYETGEHAKHGNFDWGKQWACFYAFICAFSIAIENYRDKEFLKNRPVLRHLYFAAIIVFFALMLGTRLYYYVLLLQGNNYMI